MPDGHRRDSVPPGLGARDAAVAVVVPACESRGAAGGRRPRGRGRRPHPPFGRRHCTPEAAAGLTRLALELPEPVEILERKPRIRVAVTLPDDLRVGERAVRQVDVSERPPVAVGALPVVLQPHPLAFEQPLREGTGLPAEELDRAPRIDRLRGVDADQAHAPYVVNDDRVAVDDPLDALRLRERGCEDEQYDCQHCRNRATAGTATSEPSHRPPPSAGDADGRKRHPTAAGRWQLSRTVLVRFCT